MVVSNIFTLIFTNALTNNHKDFTYYNARNCILSIISMVLIVYNNNFMLYLNKGISLYGGSFNITSLTQNFVLFILLVSSIILVYNSFYHRILVSNNTSGMQEIYNRKRNYNIIFLGDHEFNVYKLIEYPLIILFVICGASFLMCSGDLISLFISIELQSYALYILSTIHRESEQSTWGGLTYFLLGGLSSCFILLGSAILYINSGSISLEGIYIISALSEVFGNNTNFYLENNNNLIPNMYNTTYIDISLIFISVGILFKIGAAPFHFWSPDVYDALPTAVTTYVAIVAKISLFVILLDLVYYINKDPLSVSWKNTLLISSMLSLVIGSLLGLTQFRIKRVLAYSTISHLGFILLALCINNTESIQAYIFYIISYSISNLNAFIIIVAIGYELYFYIRPTNKEKDNHKQLSMSLSYKFNQNSENLTDKDIKANFEKSNGNVINQKRSLNTISEFNLLTTKTEGLKDVINSPLQLVSQLKGFYYINSYLCLSLTITLFSFVGIPPLIGFFGKQMVLSAALDNGYVFISLIAIITSVIGAVYYLNIVKHMFFFKPDYVINPTLLKWSKEKNYLGEYTNVTSFKNNKQVTNNIYNLNHLSINTALSITISILSLSLSLFIFIPNESFNLAKILAIFLFK